MFMLSFYLVGMNSVDLFNSPAPENGRITYTCAKTKDRHSDKSKISIKIEPEAQEIINRYTGKERRLNLHYLIFKDSTLNSHNNYQRIGIPMQRKKVKGWSAHLSPFHLTPLSTPHLL
jgi:hypothetical protein